MILTKNSIRFAIKQNLTDKKKDLKEYKKVTEMRIFCQKKLVYNVGMIQIALTDGLKPEKLDSKKIHFYYRFLQIFHVLLFELFISSLQPTPKIQITLILGTQIIFFFTTLYCVAWKGIFDNMFWSIVSVLDELCILSFLALVAVMEFLQRENISVEFWTRMQLISIYFVIFSSGVNIIVMGLQLIYAFFEGFFSFFWFKNSFGEKLSRSEINDIEEVLEKEFLVSKEMVEKFDIELMEEFGHVFENFEQSDDEEFEVRLNREENEFPAEDERKFDIESDDGEEEKEGEDGNQDDGLYLEEGENDVDFEIVHKKFRDKRERERYENLKFGVDKQMMPIPNQPARRQKKRKKKKNFFQHPRHFFS